LRLISILFSIFPLIFFLELVPKKSLSCRLKNRSSVFCKTLYPGELFRPWDKNLGVRFNELGKVAKEAVSRFKEVELWVTLLFLSEALEEFLAVPRNKLSCKLDNIHIDVRQDWMTNRELLLRIWSHFSSDPSLLWIATENKFFELPLILIFSLPQRRSYH
jgi:hypothetical protein